MKTRSWKFQALIVLSLAALTALTAPGVVAADHRLRVEIDEPFVIDGQTYEAAMLVVRQVGNYNPTATMNEVWVGKRCLGVMLARELNDADLASSDSVLFVRDGQGLLVLTGISFRGERPRSLYGVGEPADVFLAQDQTASAPTQTALALNR